MFKSQSFPRAIRNASSGKFSAESSTPSIAQPISISVAIVPEEVTMVLSLTYPPEGFRILFSEAIWKLSACTASTPEAIRLAPLDTCSVSVLMPKEPPAAVTLPLFTRSVPPLATPQAPPVRAILPLSVTSPLPQVESSS